MAKDEDDVRVRLQRTALKLFRERGYDRTTAAEIAARTGVTERTFFRYFPDKREVLFEGEAILRAALTDSIANAPAELGPLGILFRAFQSVTDLLESNRFFSVPQQEVIVATPALQERELAKHAALADALADALKTKGVPDLPAVLAARIGMAAFVHATTAWLADAKLSLRERLALTAAGLKLLI